MSPTLGSHLGPRMVVHVFNVSAGCWAEFRQFPGAHQRASMAITELQVQRETLPQKLRCRLNGATLKAESPCPGSCCLSIVYQLGDGLCAHVSCSCWAFVWLKFTQRSYMSPWLGAPLCSCLVEHRDVSLYLLPLPLIFFMMLLPQ